MTATVQQDRTYKAEPAHKRSFVLLLAGILAIKSDSAPRQVASSEPGTHGMDQAVAQNVVTPDDAVIPETPVRGPFTMWAPADIITYHQLESTGGLYYAEMDRMVPAIDESGEAVPR